MNENSGADVSTDGGVVPTGGVVKEVEEHVKAFLGASSDDERVKILDTCWKTVEALDMRARINFKYYTHVLGKISAKGEKFIETEKKRLSKILADSESLRTSQKKRFLRRINVLTSFDEL